MDPKSATAGNTGNAIEGWKTVLEELARKPSFTNSNESQLSFWKRCSNSCKFAYKPNSLIAEMFTTFSTFVVFFFFFYNNQQLDDNFTQITPWHGKILKSLDDI
jgi:hypothetical protein